MLLPERNPLDQLKDGHVDNKDGKRGDKVHDEDVKTVKNLVAFEMIFRIKNQQSTKYKAGSITKNNSNKKPNFLHFLCKFHFDRGNQPIKGHEAHRKPRTASKKVHSLID